MSYLVLARKYRPKRFSEMMGQDHVMRALQNALERNQLHHAYLFTGTRGVGKTTIARLFAKCLNCERAISASPCGECTSCIEIDQGRHIDLLEIDAASRTKVEDTRDLLENVQYLPQHGRFKIYLIDEVHMLSGHSFNALLKTLEEPPPHVKFLLATTDPQRLPATVLSRCLQLHLKNMTAEQIVNQLAIVAEKENLTVDKDALVIIAKAALGSMRDALSLFDQAIAYSNGNVKTDDVINMLGLTSHEAVIELLSLLAMQNADALINKAEELAMGGADFLATLDSILEILQEIAVAQVLKKAEGDIKDLADQLKPQDVQLYYQIALLGKRDLPLSPDPKSGFLMVLIRMLAFTPNATTIITPPAPPKATITRPSSCNSTPIKNTASENKIIAQLIENKVIAQPSENKIIATQWEKILPQLNLSGVAQLLAQNCALQEMQNGRLALVLDGTQSALLNPASEERLAKALETYLGTPCQLEIRVAKSVVDSPAKLQQKQTEKKMSVLHEQLTTDKNLQSLMQKFSATIQPDSIVPNE
jgi:DNA polymerase III subunit gamma/tau